LIIIILSNGMTERAQEALLASVHLKKYTFFSCCQNASRAVFDIAKAVRSSSGIGTDHKELL